MLGRTGLEISPIGIGGAGLCGCPSDAAASEVTAAFLKAGVNFIDTSPAYGAGESERRLGVALADVPRSAYVLQTKMGDGGPQNGGHSAFSREGVLASVRHSLEVLRVPHVDSLLLHDPYADEVATFLGKGGGMEAVRELMGAGVVRHFGCGAREHEAHLQLLESCPAEFAVAQTVDVRPRGVQPSKSRALRSGSVADVGRRPARRRRRVLSTRPRARVRRTRTRCAPSSTSSGCARPAHAPTWASSTPRRSIEGC